jgi:hypothetical protein
MATKTAHDLPITNQAISDDA